jgi:hypothetical protein
MIGNEMNVTARGRVPSFQAKYESKQSATAREIAKKSELCTPPIEFGKYRPVHRRKATTIAWRVRRLADLAGITRCDMRGDSVDELAAMT